MLGHLQQPEVERERERDLRHVDAHQGQEPVIGNLLGRRQENVLQILGKKPGRLGDRHGHDDAADQGRARDAGEPEAVHDRRHDGDDHDLGPLPDGPASERVRMQAVGDRHGAGPRFSKRTLPSGPGRGTRLAGNPFAAGAAGMTGTGCRDPRRPAAGPAKTRL